jgi:hypothetical protein
MFMPHVRRAGPGHGRRTLRRIRLSAALAPFGEDGIEIKRLAAEAIGTFCLTFAGCGSAVIAAAFPQVGIGLLGVSSRSDSPFWPWPMRSAPARSTGLAPFVGG